MTTKSKLTEQAKRLIKGGEPSIGSNVMDEEITEYLGQVLNDLLRTEFFSTTLPTGETIPAGYVLASYDNLPIEKYKGTCRVRLPAYPVILPRNTGLFHIGPSNDLSEFYIPTLPGESRIMKSQGILNALERPSYELVNGYAVIDRDITGPDCSVTMQLVVLDMSAYGEYDILPIPANMEKTILDATVSRFMGEPRPDKQVDSSSEPTKTQQTQTRTR